MPSPQAALIVESSMPRSAGVVAAPMRELCLAKFGPTSSAACSADRSFDMNRAFVHGVLSQQTKSGPASIPRMARKDSTAATGQIHNSGVNV